MIGNIELTNEVIKHYERISEISGYPVYISYSDALHIVKDARLNKKLARHNDGSERLIHCLNEFTGELEYIPINYKSSLLKYCVILTCDSHYITKQQINKYLSENNFKDIDL